MARVDAPCTPEKFWNEVALIGWSERNPAKFYNTAKARLLRRCTGEFLEEFDNMKEELYGDLAAAVEKVVEETGKSTGCGDDGFSDLIHHVIGLGKEEYEAAMKDPMRVIQRGLDCRYDESFGYCIPYGKDMELVSKGLYLKRARQIVEDLTALKQSRFGEEFEDLDGLLALTMRVVNGEVELFLTEGLGERVKHLREERTARLEQERKELDVLDSNGWLFDNTVTAARTYLAEETAA